MAKSTNITFTSNTSMRVSTLITGIAVAVLFTFTAMTKPAIANQLSACDSEACVSYFKKFKRAARKGYVSAQYNTAKFYYYGYGTDIDKALALKYYRKTAVNGSKEAQYMTGLIYVSEPDLQDHEQGIYWLERAAANGHIHASFLLGKAHAQGDVEKGNPPNYEASDKWLSRSFDTRDNKLPALIEALHKKNVFNETNYPSLYHKLVEHNMWLAKNSDSEVALSNWDGKTYERMTITGYSQTQAFDNLLATFRGRNNSTGSRLGGDCQLTAACTRKSLNEMKDSMWVSQK
ncbi:sel1 repeat family protein [Thalassotalea euphylliae]|uniref:Sel1 repeat family protein n=1 Tax=Thalassotalea euphylliae TaxID=1655234 RepID=A0A3E0TRL9_9GAMM|nr:tetratricopeptide repeat protein [Thalassotalea euphylliae]REL27281.1 sel1 repeat family protein [Thalassotalea euphylliae]